MLPGYELEEKLGEGAFGAVYKAVQESTGQAVAVKVLTRVSSRFREEVARLSSVSEHPHIVTLLDAKLEHQPPYIVTPLLSGSLADEIPQVPKEGNLERVCVWFRELAGALEYVHSRGILHCDLKPANVLLGENGFARLTDFGQATLQTDEKGRMGSFWYMPIKQTEGSLPHVSWDLYALGATIYTLLTGVAPRSSKDAIETLHSRSTVSEKIEEYRKALGQSQLKEVRSLNPRVDEELAWIVQHCLREEGGYTSATELLQDLSHREQGLPLLARPSSYGYWLRRFVERHKLTVLVGTVSLAVLLTGFAYSSHEVYKARQARKHLVQEQYERGVSLLESGQATGLVWLLKAYILEPREEFRRALVDSLANQPQVSKPFLYRLRTATAPSPSGHWAIWRDPSEKLEKKLVDLRTGGVASLPPHIYNSKRDQKDRVRYRLDGVELSPREGSGGPATWRMRSSGSLLPSEDTSALALRVGPERVLRVLREGEGLQVLDQADNLLLEISRSGDVPLNPTFSLQGALAVGWEKGGTTCLEPSGSVRFEDPNFYSDLICFSPDGALMAGSDGNSKLRVWNKEGETLAEFSISTAANELCFDSEASKLVCATRDGLVYGFDLTSQKPAWPPIKLQKAARWLYLQQDGHIVTMSDVITVWKPGSALDDRLKDPELLRLEIARRTGWIYDRERARIRTLSRDEYQNLFPHTE